ncbi:nitroreductase family protein [Effusibacillus dendaii]|uniref:Putative NAD(P)H nitroreductase YfhC n=1 Tax=Effusibacillus dendaii TaxID=2743772 RepID=A0A7I8D585_9BACL|nr:nitroreductase [Effusibacillus dendaii]BCJ85245.1 putative NAD(P)H nitroreductase YfhC [Effusibacillus dendaii]
MSQTGNVLETIRTRRTIKTFKPDPVARELLQELLNAASWAPNHRMTEPWQVLFVGPETRAKLHHKTDFGGAPVLLAILCEPGKTEIDQEEHYAAVACFITNFMLAAWEKGIGTGWSSLAASQHVRELLGVQEGTKVVGLLPVGYPAEVPSPKERTPMEQKIKYLP